MLKKIFSFLMVLTMLIPFSSTLVSAEENVGDSGWAYQTNIKDSDKYYYIFVVLKATREVKDTTVVGYLEESAIGANDIPSHINGAQYNNHMTLDGYHFDNTNLSIAHISQASEGDDFYFLLLAPKDSKNLTLRLAVNNSNIDITDLKAKDKAGEKINIASLGNIPNMQSINLDLSQSFHFDDTKKLDVKPEDFVQKDVKKTESKVETKSLTDNNYLLLLGSGAGIAILIVIIGTVIYLKKAN